MESEPTYTVPNHYGRLETKRASEILKLAATPEFRHCLTSAVRAYDAEIADAFALLTNLCAIIKSPIERYMLCGFFEAGRKYNTPIELAGRPFVEGAGVPVVLELQKPIGVYFADFALTDAVRLVVECDGAEFHTDKVRDVRRDDVLRANGWRVMRFTGERIYKDPAACAAEALRAARG